MNILLKSATIISPGSKYHLKKRDILIENGVISKIAATISDSGKVKSLRKENLHVSMGWFDPSVSFGEPGYEERETIENGLKVAAQSGFSHVAVNCNTLPVTDSNSAVKYFRTKAIGSPVNLYAVGALSAGTKGENLAELFDMKNSGAVAFYDYKQPIKNSNLLKIALQYSENFDALIQSFPFDESIASNGVVNEEINSTRLGLRGIPALSEELQVLRDLQLLEYAGGKLHIPTISTRKSVAHIREAKNKGLNVSCSVAVTNLVLTDDELDTYDTNFKLMPPLRTTADTRALLRGLKDGVIDGATSDHCPMDVESKKTEFDHAAFGSIGLESCFGALGTKLDASEAVEALTRLKGQFDIPIHEIAEGNRADLTLFDPDAEWVFSESDIRSKSRNAAFLGKTLKGRVYGIISNNQIKVD